MVVSILFVLLLVVANVLASPRFEPASTPSNGQDRRASGNGRDTSRGLARVNAVPANDSAGARSSSSSSSSATVNKQVPEALKRFNFNARKADFARTPRESDEDGDNDSSNVPASHLDVDWTSHTDDPVNQNELADIALVVTVDGSIHAIKRDTGTWVWSLHDENEQEQRQEVMQTPLFRSSMRNSSSSSSSGGHGKAPSVIDNGRLEKGDSSDEDSEDDDEIYIIEPHSAGDIYVYHKSTSKLQRLPLSLTQLVELSPFTFPVRGSGGTDKGDTIDTDNKLFVGRKESKLVGVDLKSGKLVGVFGPEEGWCEWPQSPSRGGNKGSGAGSPGSGSTRGILEDEAIENRPRDLLYLGQTDYHLSIYSKTQGLLQTLSYTSYGPSSLGHTPSPIGPLATSAEEAEYQASHDHRYIQPMHDGSLVCLNPEKEGIQWTNRFSQPVVGVFDIWYPATKEGDTATSQPVLAVHPHHRIHNQLEELANIPPSTFIGKLARASSAPSSSGDDHQEYYAMSNYHFPLVSFAPASRAISGSPASGTASDGDGPGQRQNRSQYSIVGSHRIDEPIDSGRTISGPSPPLSIDPPDAPPQLPPSDGSAWNRPTLPPASHEAGYGEAMWRYMSIGAFEPHVSLLETIALLGGLLIFSFAFMRKKMVDGRTPKRSAETVTKPEQSQRASENAGDVGSDISASKSITPERKSESSSSTSNGGTQPRRLPSHASSRSLDKALPALPMEELPKNDEVQSEDEEGGEGDENGLEKVKNPKKGRRRKRGGKRNAVRLANGNAAEEKEQSSPEIAMKEELKEETKMVVVDTAPTVVAKDESSSGRIGSLEVSENVLGESCCCYKHLRPG